MNTITREQFNSIGKFVIDDYPIDNSNQDLMYEVFIRLPERLQNLAIQWGFNDTEVREQIFEFFCMNQLNVTTEQFYKTGLFNIYSKYGDIIEVNFERLDNK